MKKLLAMFLALVMALSVTTISWAEGEPTLSNGVWSKVTKDNVQALLDGEYGSIDNMTIVLSAGTYGQLELGRATKYASSGTKYYVGLAGVGATPPSIPLSSFLHLKQWPVVWHPALCPQHEQRDHQGGGRRRGKGGGRVCVLRS